MGLKELVWVTEVPTIALSCLLLLPYQVKCLNDPKNERSRERESPEHLSGSCIFSISPSVTRLASSGCSGYKVVLIAKKCFVMVHHLWPGLALKLSKSMGTLSTDSFKAWISFIPWQKKAWQSSNPHESCQMACDSARTYGGFWRGGNSPQRGTSPSFFCLQMREGECYNTPEMPPVVPPALQQWLKNTLSTVTQHCTMISNCR